MLEDTTMIAATLQRLHQAGHLTIGAMARATGIDESSFYKWMAGAHDPAFTKIALIFRHCGSRDVQAAILDLITCGTPWICSELPSGDIDGDGDIDRDDIYKGTVAGLKDLAEMLDKVSRAEDRIDVRQREAIAFFGNKAIRSIFAAIRASQLAPSPTRRKARPLTEGRKP